MMVKLMKPWVISTSRRNRLVCSHRKELRSLVVVLPMERLKTRLRTVPDHCELQVTLLCLPHRRRHNTTYPAVGLRW